MCFTSLLINFVDMTLICQIINYFTYLIAKVIKYLLYLLFFRILRRAAMISYKLRRAAMISYNKSVPSSAKII